LNPQQIAERWRPLNWKVVQLPLEVEDAQKDPAPLLLNVQGAENGPEPCADLAALPPVGQVWDRRPGEAGAGENV